ncbi:MAG TPA: hypothetical protein ENJ78_00865, partial [candidate division WWE3 bacterium]|nr:hypothetical protein [candidate division WWE3 bacterium]
MINIIKIRFITYTLSLITIFIGFYFVFNYGIKFSTEFTGGTTITFEGDTIKKEELKNIITPFAKDT